jgi:hypothetical protein
MEIHSTSPGSIAEMNEELTAFIIKELGKLRSQQGFIQKVCEQGGLNWKDAERLITFVEAQHKGTIASRQTPLWSNLPRIATYFKTSILIQAKQ